MHEYPAKLVTNVDLSMLYADENAKGTHEFVDEVFNEVMYAIRSNHD